MAIAAAAAKKEATKNKWAMRNFIVLSRGRASACFVCSLVDVHLRATLPTNS